MVIVTPKYCKSIAFALDEDGKMHIDIEFTRPLRRMMRVVDTAMWIARRIAGIFRKKPSRLISIRRPGKSFVTRFALINEIGKFPKRETEEGQV